MSDPASQIEALIQTLRTGSPRAAYQAGRDLARFGRAAEIPLLHFLKEVRDANRIHDALNILEAVKISDPTAVDTVVRLLSHGQFPVRRSAAHCLLASSPKLRRFVGEIRAAMKTEKDESVREILQKLLDRYPEKSAS